MIVLSTDIDTSYILKKIKNSFLNVIRGKVSLREANIIALFGSESERFDAGNLDTAKVWWEISDENIEKHPDILGLVDLDIWRYYLPAYMTWVIRNYLTTDSFSKFAIVFDLENEQNLIRKFCFLNKDQSESVFCF